MYGHLNFNKTTSLLGVEVGVGVGWTFKCLHHRETEAHTKAQLARKGSLLTQTLSKN